MYFDRELKIFRSQPGIVPVSTDSVKNRFSESLFGERRFGVNTKMLFYMWFTSFRLSKIRLNKFRLV